eukprot:g69462.t1
MSTTVTLWPFPVPNGMDVSVWGSIGWLLCGIFFIALNVIVCCFYFPCCRGGCTNICDYIDEDEEDLVDRGANVNVTVRMNTAQSASSTGRDRETVIREIHNNTTTVSEKKSNKKSKKAKKSVKNESRPDSKPIDSMDSDSDNDDQVSSSDDDEKEPPTAQGELLRLKRALGDCKIEIAQLRQANKDLDWQLQKASETLLERKGPDGCIHCPLHCEKRGSPGPGLWSRGFRSSLGYRSFINLGSANSPPPLKIEPSDEPDNKNGSVQSTADLELTATPVTQEDSVFAYMASVGAKSRKLDARGTHLIVTPGGSGRRIETSATQAKTGEGPDSHAVTVQPSSRNTEKLLAQARQAATMQETKAFSYPPPSNQPSKEQIIEQTHQPALCTDLQATLKEQNPAMVGRVIHRALASDVTEGHSCVAAALAHLRTLVDDMGASQKGTFALLQHAAALEASTEPEDTGLNSELAAELKSALQETNPAVVGRLIRRGLDSSLSEWQPEVAAAIAHLHVLMGISSRRLEIPTLLEQAATLDTSKQAVVSVTFSPSPLRVEPGGGLSEQEVLFSLSTPALNGPVILRPSPASGLEWMPEVVEGSRTAKQPVRVQASPSVAAGVYDVLVEASAGAGNLNNLSKSPVVVKAAVEVNVQHEEVCKDLEAALKEQNAVVVGRVVHRALASDMKEGHPCVAVALAHLRTLVDDTGGSQKGTFALLQHAASLEASTKSRKPSLDMDVKLAVATVVDALKAGSHDMESSKANLESLTRLLAVVGEDAATKGLGQVAQLKPDAHAVGVTSGENPQFREVQNELLEANVLKPLVEIMETHGPRDRLLARDSLGMLCTLMRGQPPNVMQSIVKEMSPGVKNVFFAHVEEADTTEDLLVLMNAMADINEVGTPVSEVDLENDLFWFSEKEAILVQDVADRYKSNTRLVECAVNLLSHTNPAEKRAAALEASTGSQGTVFNSELAAELKSALQETNPAVLGRLIRRGLDSSVPEWQPEVAAAIAHLHVLMGISSRRLEIPTLLEKTATLDTSKQAAATLSPALAAELKSSLREKNPALVGRLIRRGLDASVSETQPEVAAAIAHLHVLMGDSSGRLETPVLLEQAAALDTSTSRQPAATLPPALAAELKSSLREKNPALPEVAAAIAHLHVLMGDSSGRLETPVLLEQAAALDTSTSRQASSTESPVAEKSQGPDEEQLCRDLEERNAVVVGRVIRRALGANMLARHPQLAAAVAHLSSLTGDDQFVSSAQPELFSAKPELSSNPATEILLKEAAAMDYSTQYGEINAAEPEPTEKLSRAETSAELQGALVETNPALIGKVIRRALITNMGERETDVEAAIIHLHECVEKLHNMTDLVYQEQEAKQALLDLLEEGDCPLFSDQGNLEKQLSGADAEALWGIEGTVSGTAVLINSLAASGSGADSTEALLASAREVSQKGLIECLAEMKTSPLFEGGPSPTTEMAQDFAKRSGAGPAAAAVLKELVKQDGRPKPYKDVTKGAFKIVKQHQTGDVGPSDERLDWEFAAFTQFLACPVEEEGGVPMRKVRLAAPVEEEEMWTWPLKRPASSKKGRGMSRGSKQDIEAGEKPAAFAIPVIVPKSRLERVQPGSLDPVTQLSVQPKTQNLQPKSEMPAAEKSEEEKQLCQDLQQVLQERNAAVVGRVIRRALDAQMLTRHPQVAAALAHLSSLTGDDQFVASAKPELSSNPATEIILKEAAAMDYSTQYGEINAAEPEPTEKLSRAEMSAELQGALVETNPALIGKVIRRALITNMGERETDVEAAIIHLHECVEKLHNMTDLVYQEQEAKQALLDLLEEGDCPLFSDQGNLEKQLSGADAEALWGIEGTVSGTAVLINSLAASGSGADSTEALLASAREVSQKGLIECLAEMKTSPLFEGGPSPTTEMAQDFAKRSGAGPAAAAVLKELVKQDGRPKPYKDVTKGAFKIVKQHQTGDVGPSDERLDWEFAAFTQFLACPVEEEGGVPMRKVRLAAPVEEEEMWTWPLKRPASSKKGRGMSRGSKQDIEAGEKPAAFAIPVIVPKSRLERVQQGSLDPVTQLSVQAEESERLEEKQMCQDLQDVLQERNAAVVGRVIRRALDAQMLIRHPQVAAALAHLSSLTGDDQFVASAKPEVSSNPATEILLKEAAAMDYSTQYGEINAAEPEPTEKLSRAETSAELQGTLVETNPALIGKVIRRALITNMGERETDVEAAIIHLHECVEKLHNMTDLVYQEQEAKQALLDLLEEGDCPLFSDQGNLEKQLSGADAEALWGIEGTVSGTAVLINSLAASGSGADSTEALLASAREVSQKGLIECLAEMKTSPLFEGGPSPTTEMAQDFAKRSGAGPAAAAVLKELVKQDGRPKPYKDVTKGAFKIVKQHQTGDVGPSDERLDWEFAAFTQFLACPVEEEGGVPMRKVRLAAPVEEEEMWTWPLKRPASSKKGRGMSRGSKQDMEAGEKPAAFAIPVIVPKSRLERMQQEWLHEAAPVQEEEVWSWPLKRPASASSKKSRAKGGKQDMKSEALAKPVMGPKFRLAGPKSRETPYSRRRRIKPAVQGELSNNPFQWPTLRPVQPVNRQTDNLFLWPKLRSAEPINHSRPNTALLQPILRPSYQNAFFYNRAHLNLPTLRATPPRKLTPKERFKQCVERVIRENRSHVKNRMVALKPVAVVDRPKPQTTSANFKWPALKKVKGNRRVSYSAPTGVRLV